MLAGRPARPPAAAKGGTDAGSDSGNAARTAEDIPPPMAASCTAPLQAPNRPCFARDVAEPNDKNTPVALPIEPDCGYVQANISAGDDDAYEFTTLKSDPVLIELTYESSSEADLEQTLYSSTGSLLTNEQDQRKGPGETLRSVIQGTAHASYVVRVRDTYSNNLCQSYALRVDPLYCSDEHEDNDSMETSKKLSWDMAERVTVTGALLSTDDDFFEVTTPRADPVRVTGFYTASPGSTVQVSRSFFDAAGALKDNVSGDRKTDTEKFTHWLSAPSKSTVLRTRLTANGGGCATYELTLDAAACTDEYEDNDLAEEAAMLAPGNVASATIYRTDEDYYALKPLEAGSCSLTYDIPSGRSQSLSLAVHDGAGSLVDNESGGELNGTVRSLKVSWTNHDVMRVRVVANEGGYCQPYTLRCDAAEGK